MRTAILYALFILAATLPAAVAVSPANAASVINVPADYPTIGAAVDAAADGDTIMVQPGTYREQVRITRRVTLQSRFVTSGNRGDIANTIIDGGGADKSKVIRVDGGAAGTVIQGFTIRNADDGVRPTVPIAFLDGRIHDTHDGIDFENGSGGRVARSVFEDNSDDGLDLDRAVDVVIENNVIRNNQNDGIEIRLHPYTGPMLNVIIRNNTITGNGSKTPHGDGIQLIDYAVPTNRTYRIEDNVIADNHAVGIGMMADEQTTENFRGAPLGEEVVIVNNTITGNDHGITGGNNTLVVNNIITDSSRVGVKRLRGSSKIVHNLFFDNASNSTDASIQTSTSVFADPDLNADFTLRDGSPAIDAGTAAFTFNGRDAVGLTPTDYRGAAPDLGARESDGDEPPPSTQRYEVRVSKSADDAEEFLDRNQMYLTSSDLEFIHDRSRDRNQLVGIRFKNLPIAQGASITSASIQFTTDDKSSEPTALEIRAQDHDDASRFTKTVGNISNRATTSASVNWSPPPWLANGDSGAAQTTPDLAAVVQEVIDRPGWRPGAELVIIFSGSGRRVADTWDADPATAPLLVVEFEQ